MSRALPRRSAGRSSADPSDAQGAGPRLAILGRGERPSALPQAYVQRLFDDYAAALRSAPDRRSRLSRPGGDRRGAGRRRPWPPFRLGARHRLRHGPCRSTRCACGCDRLTGVDLSPAMIARARRRGLYDALETADATAFLTRSPPASFDCIVAADALPYFGDLEPVFAACRRALTKAGVLAFSVETFEGDGFRLGPAMRFAHASAYVAEIAGGLPPSPSARPAAVGPPRSRGRDARPDLRVRRDKLSRPRNEDRLAIDRSCFGGGSGDTGARLCEA